MSKRSIRKNRHRADKGKHRRTWPTSVRTIANALGVKGDHVFGDAEITITSAIHRLAQATEPTPPAREWR